MSRELPGNLNRSKLDTEYEFYTRDYIMNMSSANGVGVAQKEGTKLTISHGFPFSNGTCNRRRSSNTSKGIIIGTVTGGILFVVVAGVFCYCFCKKKVMTRGKFDRGNSMTKSA